MIQSVLKYGKIILVLCSLLFITNLWAISDSRYTLSYSQIKQAAEAGDPDAEYAFGYMLFYGKGGVQKDVLEAKRWISKAAAHHQPQAIRALQLMAGADRQVVTATNNRQPMVGTTDQSIRKDRINTAQHTSSTQYAQSQENHDQSKAVMTASPEDKNLASIDPKSKALLSKPDNYYTVQLLGSYNRTHVAKLMNDNQLNDESAIYHTFHNGKDWYVLIYGTYKTKSDAKVSAVALQKRLNLEPWVKSYAAVKNSIQKP